MNENEPKKKLNSFKTIAIIISKYISHYLDMMSSVFVKSYAISYWISPPIVPSRSAISLSNTEIFRAAPDFNFRYIRSVVSIVLLYRT